MAAVNTDTSAMGAMYSVANQNFVNIAPASATDNLLTLGSLINDVNNVSEFINMFKHGWVGSDPLWSHAFFFQPALYKGLYLPRGLVKSVTLPTYDLEQKNIKFRSTNLGYAVGSTTGNLSVVFYENQEYQVSNYLNSWMTDIVGPGGSYIGVPNDYKWTMFFVYQRSLGDSTNTLTSKLLQSVVPSSLYNAAEQVIPVSIVFLFGCYPITYERPVSTNQDFDIAEINTTFNCDAMLQIPISPASVSEIYSILGKSDSFSDLLNENLLPL